MSLQSSPHKRPRIFDSDQEEEDAGLRIRIDQLESELKSCRSQVAVLQRELQVVKNDNRSYSMAEERLADRYSDLREESQSARRRDSKVIGELHATIKRLQKQATKNITTNAMTYDASRLLNRFVDTVERTVTDVAEAEDGQDGHDCAICYDSLKMSRCSLLMCGHYYHTTCVNALQTKDILEEDEDGEPLSQVECPECRKSCFVEHVVHGLKNFDAGWEILIGLATQWKEMSSGKEPSEAAWSNESDVSAISDAEYASNKVRARSDDYVSSDEENGNSQAERTPSASPRPQTPEQTPSRAVARQLNDLQMSSAERRRTLQNLAEKRAAKRR